MKNKGTARKSFFWGLGTTSFRTKNFNFVIEEQLRLLNEFWSLCGNENAKWDSKIQELYYSFLKTKGFVKGEAKRKDKDARQKTSGLVDIGLLDENRRLTNAGKALLEISLLGDFSSDIPFQIPKDSFIYFKQLLKTSCTINGNVVRPYIVLNYVLSKVDYLSLDEFTYLLPFCINKETTEKTIQNISLVRSGTITIDEIITSTFMNISNYKDVLAHFFKANVTVDEICMIGLHRKSGVDGNRRYDEAYYPLYNALHRLYVLKDKTAITDVYEATRDVKIGKWWRAHLFNSRSPKAIYKSPDDKLKATDFYNVSTESELKKVFFMTMHLFKVKATLSDYYDLNRRYFKITDTVIFNDGKVYLDIVPKQFLSSVADELFEYAFKTSGNLSNDCELTEIAPCLIIKEEVIISGINDELGLNISSMSEARQAVMDERHKRFNKLIDNRFDDDTLISLLDKFENRNDDEIMSLVTDNADVPTIFEYVLGIIWYKISERKGNILEYMNLSLEADLLPRTHAGGG